VSGDGRDPHAECSFVGVFDGIGYWELGAGFSQPGSVLGGGVDGDVENGGGFDHFLGGEDDFLIFPDCRAEFLLDVADKKGWPIKPPSRQD